MIYIGIDPGQSGGIVFLDQIAQSAPVIYAFKNMTEKDISNLFVNTPIFPFEYFAMLEKVGAFPGQGVSSTWKFGQHYGFLRGILTAKDIAYETVTPQKWQAAMGCLTGGDKNISKAAAQRLFPTIKITHAIADALLIAEHCRRTSNTRNKEAINGVKKEN